MGIAALHPSCGTAVPTIEPPVVSRQTLAWYKNKITHPEVQRFPGIACSIVAISLDIFPEAADLIPMLNTTVVRFFAEGGAGMRCLRTGAIKRLMVFVALLGPLVAVESASAAAGEFPNRPIRLLVVSAPGGPSDGVARLIAPRLSESLARNVVVDNRPSVTGVVACEVAAKAAPDGATLLLGNSGTHAVNATLYSNLPYDPVRDFAPVSQLVLFGSVLLAHPKIAPRNFHELISAARKDPARFNIGVPGATGAVTVELLKSIAGIGLTAVPYKGSAPAEIAAISGEIDILFVSSSNAVPHVQSGRLRGLGISTAARSPLMPEVPTFGELGVRDFRVGVWHGLFAPAGTPAVLVRRLHQDLVRIFANSELRKQFADSGTEVIVNSPEEFAAKLKSEIERYRRIVTATGLQAQ